MTKGVAGFGAGHHLHTARLLELSENLPVRIEFIDTGETIDRVMPELTRLVSKGVIEVQDTTVVKASV